MLMLTSRPPLILPPGLKSRMLLLSYFWFIQRAYCEANIGVLVAGEQFGTSEITHADIEAVIAALCTMVIV